MYSGCFAPTTALLQFWHMQQQFCGSFSVLALPMCFDTRLAFMTFTALLPSRAAGFPLQQHFSDA